MDTKPRRRPESHWQKMERVRRLRRENKKLLEEIHMRHGLGKKEDW
jgi:hypothetical protein